jgi:hypothetical protein
MLFSPELHGRVARERIEERIAAAELLRHRRAEQSKLRRQLGHAIIAVGARLAAEPSLESARSS